MSDETPDTVGRRVARARKRRGLTQIGLAQRAAYSRSHVAGVESGRKVATPAFVAAAAAALGVDPAEIYGQPYRLNGHDDHVHDAIPELRRCMVHTEIGPELTGPPRALDVLAAEVATIRRLMNQAKFVKAAARLPSVIDELSYWAHESDEPRVWSLLSRALRSGVSLTYNLGYGGDSLALLERAAATAARAQDPHAQVLVTWSRAPVLMKMNQYLPALKLLEDAAANVDPTRPDASELAGAVALRAAIVSARGNLGGQAWEQYAVAEERIRSGRVGALVHEVEFTPGNVAIHGAAVAMELGDLDEAARRDQRIGDGLLASLPPSRRTHHHIDMARALAENGAYDQALKRLMVAEHSGPQMVHYHPTAHVTVAHLVDVRRTLPEPLRRLHTRLIN
ncbi:helix-turn-helix domain-containing protein [Actinomadura terrae]|uniref:helix-turn-helix domain-containing protein n=1 Tax=Actinomadura terrae TaxID=604353 RepID=UPI001FA74DB0|nr:helix-turn-helix domain-containing protein [Actinomadura terrae]